MSDKSRVPFILVRLKNFLRLLTKSRLAFSGMLLLIIFIVGAAAAPILTTSYPTEKVAAGLVPPAWTAYVFGATRYSQNIQFGGLAASTNTTGTGLSLQSTLAGPDAIDVHVNSTSGGTILIAKTLNYPYSASPLEFEGTVSIIPTGVSATRPANAIVFMERKDLGQYGPLWNSSLVTSGQQYHQELQSFGLEQRLGFVAGTNLGQVIFSGKGTYSLVLMLTLPQGPFQAEFVVTKLTMSLFGNSFGLLGSDAQGADIFSQLLYGARLSLMVGLVATGIGIGLGLVIGLMAGFLGKAVDEILMRFTDMMLVIPSLPLLIVLATVLGSSLLNIIIILGFLGWMGFARLVRSQVLSLRERPFIEAAKASGAGTGYILSRHIFPNIVGLTYVNLALSVPAAIVGEAALSFLGLGDNSAITWGKMLELANESHGGLAWWWVVPPGVGIALLSLAFILVGYSLDELFNPRLRRRR
ncbi:ABC transporter permease [Candidatus Bathyarchaeota archaeon]|nr:MAG: ABC transporter permease [Candidatus Bathyarchaeota archaeon]